jgi:hypothetical protein
VVKGRPARKADNLTAISEAIFWRKCGNLDVLQPSGPSRPVTGLALRLLLLCFIDGETALFANSVYKLHDILRNDIVTCRGWYA